MNKILIALLMLILVTVNPFNSYAAEISTHTSWTRINVDGNDIDVEVIIQEDGDILFSIDSLEQLTKFSVSKSSTEMIFKRGLKKVTININKKELQIISLMNPISLENKIVEYDDDLYVSGSIVLPWLNVNCIVKDSKLYIINDEVSFWDFKDIDLDNTFFNLNAVCSEIGVNSNALKIRAFLQGNGLKSLLYLVPIDFNISYGDYNEYYEIFEELYNNNNNILNNYNDIMDLNEKNTKLYDLLGDNIKNENFDLLPDALRAHIISNDILSKSKYGLDIILFYKTLEQNYDIENEMMQAIQGECHSNKFPDSMIAASRDAEINYSDKIEGIEYKVMQELQNFSIDTMEDILSEGILKYLIRAVNLGDVLAPEWIKTVKHIPKYEAIQENSIKAYNEERYENSQSLQMIKPGLTSLRSHALLCSYASQMCWQAMQQYCHNKNKLDMEIECNNKAQICSDLYTKISMSWFSTENDTIGYDSEQTKNKYRDKLLNYFGQITLFDIKPITKTMLEELNDFEGSLIEENNEYYFIFYNTIDIYSNDGATYLKSINNADKIKAFVHPSYDPEQYKNQSIKVNGIINSSNSDFFLIIFDMDSIDGQLNYYTNLTATDALELVKNYVGKTADPSVCDILSISIDSVDKGYYHVHVYEKVRWEEEDGHTATWGWIDVDRNTGEMFDTILLEPINMP